MSATKQGPMTTCPRCGAQLSPSQAHHMPGPAGYHGVMGWPHRRPDSGKRCFVSSGPPLARAVAARPAEATPGPTSEAEQEDTDGPR